MLKKWLGALPGNVSIELIPWRVSGWAGIQRHGNGTKHVVVLDDVNVLLNAKRGSRDQAEGLKFCYELQQFAKDPVPDLTFVCTGGHGLTDFIPAANVLKPSPLLPNDLAAVTAMLPSNTTLGRRRRALFDAGATPRAVLAQYEDTRRWVCDTKTAPVFTKTMARLRAANSQMAQTLAAHRGPVWTTLSEAAVETTAWHTELVPVPVSEDELRRLRTALDEGELVADSVYVYPRSVRALFNWK